MKAALRCAKAVKLSSCAREIHVHVNLMDWACVLLWRFNHPITDAQRVLIQYGYGLERRNSHHVSKENKSGLWIDESGWKSEDVKTIDSDSA